MAARTQMNPFNMYSLTYDQLSTPSGIPADIQRTKVITTQGLFIPRYTLLDEEEDALLLRRYLPVAVTKETTFTCFSAYILDHGSELFHHETLEKVEAIRAALLCNKISAVSFEPLEDVDPAEAEEEAAPAAQVEEAPAEESEPGTSSTESDDYETSDPPAQIYFVRKYNEQDVPMGFVIKPHPEYSFSPDDLYGVNQYEMNVKFISNPADIDSSLSEIQNVDMNTLHHMRNVLIYFLSDSSTRRIGISYRDVAGVEKISVWSKPRP